MNCPSCDQSIPDDSKFCKECGSPVVDPTGCSIIPSGREPVYFKGVDTEAQVPGGLPIQLALPGVAP